MTITDLIDALRLRAATIPPAELLLKMGYKTASASGIERLRHVLDDVDLGLKDGGFDFHFCSKDFLCSLCDVIGIEKADYLPAVADIETRLQEEVDAFKPYLFVDTGFHRKDEQIFVMAILENGRYVQFPRNFWRLPWPQQLEKAGEQVREHMKKTGGKLQLWGQIQRYFYFFAEGRAMEISVQGVVLGERDNVVPSRATLEKGVDKLLASSLPPICNSHNE